MFTGDILSTELECQLYTYRGRLYVRIDLAVIDWEGQRTWDSHYYLISRGEAQGLLFDPLDSDVAEKVRDFGRAIGDQVL